MRSYLTLSCRLSPEREDALTQVLENWPVLGCQVEDARPDIVVTIFLDAAHVDEIPRISGELLLLGAREDQVEAVSLGEEKPRCSEAGESCWSKNRRDDMLYTGEY